MTTGAPPMETRVVSKLKALELQAVVNAAKSGRLKVGPEHHKIEVNGEVMLVDPVNGAPFVFVAPNTVHIFQFKLGSGTDHLRRRIDASQCFQKLSHATNDQAQKKPQGASRLGM